MGGDEPCHILRNLEPSMLLFFSKRPSTINEMTLKSKSV